LKQYKITVNGKTFDVDVEEVGGAPEIKSVAPAPAAPKAAAPAPKAAPAPAPKAAPKAAAPKGAGTEIAAPMGGNVLSVAVSEGQQVNEGDLLFIFEAMKMENEMTAPVSGTVTKISIEKGQAIEAGAVAMIIA